jgi:hypothetical protein
VRLFVKMPVCRFLGLALLLFFAIPFGMSVSGCKTALAPEYCNAGDTGPVVGQVASIQLSPVLTTLGESLSYGQIGQSLTASALDCKGNSVSVRGFTFASSNMNIADINPATGQVCAGQFNRNTGGGVADYQTCTANATEPPVAPAVVVTPGASPYSYTAPATGALSISGGTVTSITTTTSGTTSATGITTGVIDVNPNEIVTITYTAAPTIVFTPADVAAYVTATADGAVSNSIPIYLHPEVTSILLGAPTANCSTDPASTCCPANAATVYTPAPQPYSQNSCVSQNHTAQLVARVYAYGGTTTADNITCQIGHLQYAPQSSSNILQIDQNGVATANQPGSTLITATVANSSSASSAGFFSTCPPESITLSIPNQPVTTTSTTENVNNALPLIATVTDTNGNPITGLSLEFESTTPQTAPASSSTIIPVFPGSATITALCQPGACNPSPFSQIGYLGNGKPLQSNGITVNTTGTVATVLYMGSTQSQYIFPMDFSTNLQSSPIKLPYAPNSMVISQDGSAIYLGSPQGLMIVATANNSVSGPNLNVPGVVLAVSPDGSTLVISDGTVAAPSRQTIELYSTNSGGITTTYGGIGTRAVWTPDSQMVYITTAGGALLTHSAFVNWQTTPSNQLYQDAVVTVPSIGAYFASGTPGATTGTTDGRSYCASTTQTTAGTPPTESNTYAPIADLDPALTDKLGATNDGKHILGAHANTTGASTFSDILVTFPTQTDPTTGAITPAACPQPPPAVSTPIAPGYFVSVPKTQNLATIAATAITGVFPASNSAEAFVTYTGTGGVLPEYVPAATAIPGTLSYIKLNGTAIAPISGVWSVDNATFYTGTTGDNLVHEITNVCTTAAGVTTCAWTDTGIITPNLPNINAAGTVPVNLIVQKPKRTTS